VNVAERAKHDLQWRILCGELQPGELITVRSAAKLLGIGMTPARDALMSLRHEGLVEMRTKGTVVRQWTIEETRAHYQLRLAVERVALNWAAENMSPALHRKLIGLCERQEEFTRKRDHEGRIQTDMEFHALLVEAAHNKELTRVARGLRSLGPIVPNRGIEEGLTCTAEHREIVRFLLAGDVASATEALERHLDRPLTYLSESRVARMGGISSVRGDGMTGVGGSVAVGWLANRRKEEVEKYKTVSSE